MKKVLTDQSINESINQFRRPGPIWAFAISWLNLLWWRVGINPVNLMRKYVQGFYILK
jgi:hypothetical protein